MCDSKEKHIKLAKKVWGLYRNGTNQVNISKELNINRAEVSHIIKYTTSSLFLTKNESEDIIDTLSKEKETLLKELNKWKFSNSDAYLNNHKLNEKLTYKRLCEIYKNKLENAQQEKIDGDEKYKENKKLYWGLCVFITILAFATGVYIKGYLMQKQNYHQIDVSTSWKSQEGDTLYRLIENN